MARLALDVAQRDIGGDPVPRRLTITGDVAGEAAILRFEGWLLVAYGLIVIASAFLMPMSLIAPLFGSMSLASLVVILVRRRQLRKTLTPS